MREKEMEISIVSDEEKALMSDYAKVIVDYRRTGISLNHIIGCPINCAYCVRHFWGNFDMKIPKLLCSDEDAVEALVSNKFFVKHDIPIQFLHKATDPFLPGVKEHTFNVLKILDEMKLTNIVMLITRYKITENDVIFLDSLKNIRVCLFFTYSGITDEKIEPLSSREYAIEFAKVLQKVKRNRLKVIQYWRPIVNGWNDDNETIRKVLSIANYFDAIVIKGLRHKKENDAYFRRNDICINHEYGQYEKILTNESVEKILDIHRAMDVKTPIFYKTSCAIAYSTHTSDYNRQVVTKRSCYNCTIEQQALCEGRLPVGDAGALEKILSKEVRLVREGVYKVIGGTREEKLFGCHFLQKEVVLEERI